MADTLTDNKSIVEKGYDKVADRYLAWSAPRPTTTRSEYISRLLAQLPDGASVLELGCGAGVPSTQTFVAHGFAVTGVDISAAQIELARKHVPSAKALIQSDMLKLNFAEGSFDAVIAFYSIFHLPKEEHGEMFVKIMGWLKEGGWLLCNLHAKEGDVMFEDWMGARMFSSGLGVKSTRDVLRKDAQGLKVIMDEVAVEKVGPFEEHFHWIFAQKKSQ